MSVTGVASDQRPVPRHGTKVVVLIRDGLLLWQELNITAFLMSGVVTIGPAMVGAPYVDGDGNEYLPMLR